MRKFSVLTEIVAKRNLPPEPIATEALVHLLSRSSIARAAIVAIASNFQVGLTDVDLQFRGQAFGEEDTAYPDLVGEDSNGIRLVLEAKFDAALTSHQQGQTYVDRLEPGLPGLLLFVVPTDRVPLIWPLLLSGPGGMAPGSVPPPNHAHLSSPPAPHPLGEDRALAVISWREMLTNVRARMEGAQDPYLSDLDQLSDLVEWRTGEQWMPVLPEDLPPRVGRQIVGLLNANLLVLDILVERGFSPRLASDQHGIGAWLTTPGAKKLWIGVWLTEWARDGQSAMWIYMKERDSSRRLTLLRAFDSLAVPGEPGVFETSTGVGIPLKIQFGGEITDVASSFADQTERVALLLDESAIVTDDEEG
jgi:hypothetical protein